MYFLFRPELKNWLPRIQCHRGYWVKGAAENTLSSFKAAYQMGYQMVEFDIRLTKDQVIILFHDHEIKGKQVNELTYEDLNKIQPVTKLNHVLDWVQSLENSEFKLNIELKTTDILNSDLERKLSILLNQYNLNKQILFSSFNPFSLFKMNLLQPEIYRSILVSLEPHPFNKWYLKNMLFNFLARPNALHIQYQYWPVVQKRRKRWDVPVVLWTLNDAQVAKNYLNAHKSEVVSVISDSILSRDLV